MTKFFIDKNLSFRFSLVHGEKIDSEKLIEKIEESYKIIENAINRKCFSIAKHRLCNLKLLDISPEACSAGFNNCAVNYDGNIFFCHTHFGIKNPIGNLFEDDDLLQIISRSKSIQETKSNECEQCIYRYVCCGGCPVYRENGKDVNCKFYKTVIPKLYELYAKEKLLKILEVV